MCTTPTVIGDDQKGVVLKKICKSVFEKFIDKVNDFDL